MYLYPHSATCEINDRLRVFFSPTESVDVQEVQKLSPRFVCRRIIEQTGTIRCSRLTFSRDNAPRRTISRIESAQMVK